jgi:hypothetical protein
MHFKNIFFSFFCYFVGLFSSHIRLAFCQLNGLVVTL